MSIAVWVELRGLIGTMRLRLQLTPDPPFVSLCTLTFLGQPKVDLSCVPLVKSGLNIMDLPLISNFVQSAVDAAMAEYVAPKSLTMDLKDMLVGDDFKKDTMARGVIAVRIKRGYGFKEGDAGIGPIRKGSTDGYVTAGWAKFGKPVWSTRVILTDMTPHWEETAYILVTPDEVNVQERLRVQLWDSDRATADDDLGRIEVDLKEIMKGYESRGKMWDRQDGFRSVKSKEAMPGKLEWSVGYFPKTKILAEQLAEQSDEPEIKTVEDLKKKVEEESERKLREADGDESSEINQQKAQDFKVYIYLSRPRSFANSILGSTRPNDH
jgi:Ca2+-dependent lipid-binding protein